MKNMNMKKRFWIMNLQLFAGEGDEEDNPGEDDDPDDDDSDDEVDKEDEGEKKRFTQKDVDDAVKKRLAREKRKWQREQQKRTSGKDGGSSGKADKDEGEEESESEKRAREAEEKASALELKWTCLEHDVRKDCVDDVLALAKVHISKDDSLDIEDAIDKVLEKYPQFKDGEEDSEEDEGEDQKKNWGQRHGGGTKPKKTVDDEIRERLFGK